MKQIFLIFLLCTTFIFSSCGKKDRAVEDWLKTPEQVSDKELSLPQYINFSAEVPVDGIIATDDIRNWEIIRVTKPKSDKGFDGNSSSASKESVYALTRRGSSEEEQERISPSLQIGNTALPAAKILFTVNFNGNPNAEISFLLFDTSDLDHPGGIPAEYYWLVLSGGGDLYRRNKDGRTEPLNQITINESEDQTIGINWDQTKDFISLKCAGNVISFLRQPEGHSINCVRFDCTPGVLVFGCVIS